MKTSPARQPDIEIRYLRFLNNTLQIRELREDVCDEFTRKIFDYLEDEPLFDAQVFCTFLYKFIFKCKLYKNLVMTAETNIYDKIGLEAGSIANELSLFLGLHTVKFALPSVDPNQFHNVSIEEKLKHLIANNEPSVKAEYEGKSLIAALSRKNNPSWKAARVKIILPEMRGNMRIVPYFDLEFSLPRLSVEQKLDIIHFAICALNYLSQTGEPELVSPARPNPISDTPLPEIVSKPEHLKVVSDNLNRVRDYVILNAVRDKESDDEELNNLEFDPNAPDIVRILKAQNQDPKIEKQWLDKSSPVFVKSEAETEEIDLDENLKITLSARQWVILLRYFINHYKDYTLRDIDITAFARLLTVMNGGKNQKNFYDNLRNQKGLVTAKTREQAQEVANICRDVGFTKIADEIERAIEKVKTNYL